MHTRIISYYLSDYLTKVFMRKKTLTAPESKQEWVGSLLF